jgi:hypothetical protein
MGTSPPTPQPTSDVHFYKHNSKPNVRFALFKKKERPNITKERQTSASIS